MKNEILGYLKIEFQRQTYTSCFVGYFRSLLYITFSELAEKSPKKSSTWTFFCLLMLINCYFIALLVK